MDTINNNQKCTITMLPASEGDCFFLRFEFENKIFHLLIDTGPVSCWAGTLKPLLDQLQKKDERINCLLITHIDTDHIGGALKLFSSPPYNEMIDEVWFNGFHQVIPNASLTINRQEKLAVEKVLMWHQQDIRESDGPISAREAKSLSEYFSSNHIPVNSFNNGAAITSNTNSLVLSPNFKIDFLLPQKERLNKLKSSFQTELQRAARGTSIVQTSESVQAFENLLLDDIAETDQFEPISGSIYTNLRIEDWSRKTVTVDTSKTNASSIAICIHFYGKQFLFAGDSTAEDLERLTKPNEV